MGEPDSRGEIAHRFSPAAPEEQYVYGSCSPGWHSAANHETCLDQWIGFMESQGIERVCCLLAGRHLADERANLDKYETAFGSPNVLHEPVPDEQLVGVEHLDGEILPFVEESVETGRPVVVHGLAGVGRTGQVLAAWLIYSRGYEPSAAVETVREAGRDPTAAVDAGNATRSELFAVLGTLAERGRTD